MPSLDLLGKRNKIGDYAKISRGQMPRQLYGLGSFVKSIGKAVKKLLKVLANIVKSPLGLAALSLTIPQVRAGLGSFFGTGASFNPLKAMKQTSDGPRTQLSPFGSILSKLGLANPRAMELTGFGKTAAFGGAPSIIGGMLTKEAQEDVEELRQSGDRGLLQAYLRRYYGNLNPNASAEEIEEFVRTNSAEGGRIVMLEEILQNRTRCKHQASWVLPLNENPAGVTELDLRETGGFIPPVGVKEKQTTSLRCFQITNLYLQLTL